MSGPPAHGDLSIFLHFIDMTRPSDALKATAIYQEEVNLRAVHKRYRDGTPENWSHDQVSFDIGYLFALIERMDRLMQERKFTVVRVEGHDDDVVAAPCILSGCQYSELEKQLEDLHARLELVEEHAQTKGMAIVAPEYFRQLQLIEEEHLYAESAIRSFYGHDISIRKLIEVARGQMKTKIVDVLQEINAAAEADILAGNPITGAHHRAIEKKLRELI